LVALPAAINLAAFVLFLWLVGRLVGRFFSGWLPDAQWAVVLTVIIVVAVLLAILMFGTAVFIAVAGVVNGPFYGALAERVARADGAVLPRVPVWKQTWRGLVHSLGKVGWLLGLQLGLLVLHLLPGVGSVLYVVCAFLLTACFLGLDALDFTFDLYGLTFRERRRWCFRHAREVLGLGTATFFALMLPGANLFVPASAAVGAAWLHRELSDAGSPAAASP